MSNENENQVNAIADLVRASTVNAGVTEVPFIVVPRGFEVQDLEKLGAAPRRVREDIKLHTVESFISYTSLWKADGDSVIFCDEKARTLQAVLDYHEDSDTPTWASHRVHYKAELSREAQAWMANNGKPLPQLSFAEFMEDRVQDVVAPSGADLLERILKLQILKKVVFGSGIRLQTGEFQLNWSEENQQGTVEFPEKISLGIPLFHKGKPYKIDARLRYALNEGKVSFTYKLLNFDEALEQAFAEIVTKVTAEVTEVEVFQGSR